MVNTFLIIFLLCISLASHGETVCLKNHSQAKSAKRDLSIFLVDNDKITQVQNCLDIKVSPERVILYNKVLKSKYHVYLKNSVNSISKQECHIEAKRITKKTAKNTKIDFKKSNSSLNSKDSTSKVSQISKLTLMEGLSSSISYLDNQIDITCYKQGQNWKINFKANSPSLKLNTSRQVASGEEIELGSVIQETQSEDKKVDTHIGIKSLKRLEKKTELLYLKIN